MVPVAAKLAIGEEEQDDGEECMFGHQSRAGVAVGRRHRSAATRCRPWVVILVVELLAVHVLMVLGFWKLASLEERLVGRECGCDRAGDAASSRVSTLQQQAMVADASHPSVVPIHQVEPYPDMTHKLATGRQESTVGEEEKMPNSNIWDIAKHHTWVQGKGSDEQLEPRVRRRRSTRKKSRCKNKMPRCLKRRIHIIVGREFKNITESVKQLNRSLVEISTRSRESDLSAIHMRIDLPVTRNVHSKLDTDKQPVLIGTKGVLDGKGFRPSGTLYNFWKAAEWYKYMEGDDYLLEPGGKLSIRNNGLYLVYAQVLYQEHFITASFNLTLERSNTTRPLVTCVNSIREVDDRDSTSLFRPCQVMTIVRLDRMDNLYIEDRQRKRVYRARGSHDQEPAETSYWGLVKLRHL